MVRQLLVSAGVALSLTAFASDKLVNASVNPVARVSTEKTFLLKDANRVVAKMNDGSNGPAKVASASTNVHWKRPAGQFWGTGYNATENLMGYYFTPVMLRPWVDYTFENLSTVSSTPSWVVTTWSNESNAYEETKSSDQNVSASYLRYEQAKAPTLSYKNLSFPLQYSGEELTGKDIIVYANDNTQNIRFQSGTGCVVPVSSHYWGAFTREPVEKSGLGFFTGASVYPGMDEDYGCWFGTNASGINAMATRFEKPDQPYLLNGVYWYYQFGQDIPNDIPMKAYVFKTENDAEIRETQSGGTVEVLSIGELIATSESFVPATVSSDDNFQGAVEFKFIEKNPVTGAENIISLEIEDDITIVVTGFNADLGNGGFITSFVSNDGFDEGYGNLGFLGRLEESEDGTISYSLNAFKNFFTSPEPNTTLGVLADVSYPWLTAYQTNQPSAVKLANEGETTEEVQGLQYDLFLMSTSETDDFDVTFNGEEESDWLSIYDVYDDYETNADGEEEFSGITAIGFEAAPNPNDETRECKVVVSIPAAKYEITFVQGSKAELPTAVEVVKVDGEAKYYDLAGRRVVNPEKGIYVKVSGNKAEKVAL